MGIAGKTSTMKGTILTVLVLLVASCQMKSTKHFLVETKTLTKDEPSGEDYFLGGGSNFIGGGYGGGQGGRGYGGGHQVGGSAGRPYGPAGGFSSGGNTNNINLSGLGGNGYGNGATIVGGANSAVGSNVGGSMNSIG